MFAVLDNRMLLFWYGVNISGIWDEATRIDVKEYYQLENPLFGGSGLSRRENAESNNSIISQIEHRERLELQWLKDNPHCAFLSIAKKPLDGVKDRMGYSFRISAPADNNLAFLKHLMIDQFRISSSQVSKLLDTVSNIQIERNYKTHPISGVGFCVKDANHAYAQIYITNNRNTTSGEINSLDYDDVCDNTRLLLDGLELKYSETEVVDLLQYMYSMGMFVAFYGLDISAFGIEKVKIYFRTTRYLDFDILCHELKSLFARHGKCNDLPCWDVVQQAIKSNKLNYIDCLAIAFKQLKGVLTVDGFQFYLAP